MVEGVVTDAVPTLNDHPEFVRMLPYVVTYHEEGGFDVVLIQQVEHPGSYFGDRAIVESQINGFFHWGPSSRLHRDIVCEKLRRLFYKHVIKD